jgi:hypothetical protein
VECHCDHQRCVDGEFASCGIFDDMLLDCNLQAVGLEQSLADRAKVRIDLLKNAAATQLWVAKLEQELK